MDYKRFVYQVRWETAIDSTEEATELIESTVEALGSLLKEQDRLHLAREVPRQISEPLLTRPVEESFELKNLAAEVGKNSRSDTLFRFDNILTVCKVLNDFIDSKNREFLRQKLPESLASLFTTPIRRKKPHSSRAYPAVTARGARGDYPGRQLQNVRQN